MKHALVRSLAAALATISMSLATTVTNADQTFPTLRNPASNITAVPSLTSSGRCIQKGSLWSCANPCVNSAMKWVPGNNTALCTAYTLRAINHARSVLREPKISLPANWRSLSEDEQLFTIVDIERVTLGYPAYLGLNADLSATATVAARERRDPAPAPGFAVGYNPTGYLGIGGTWASAYNALEADYGWMYEDGWAGTRATTDNIDCTSASSNGCWGHRDELLGSSSANPNAGVGLGCTDCEVGTGFANTAGNGSEVVLIERPQATPPAMTFTWAHELGYFHGSLHIAKIPTVPTTTSSTTSSTTTPVVPSTTQP